MNIFRKFIPLSCRRYKSTYNLLNLEVPNKSQTFLCKNRIAIQNLTNTNSIIVHTQLQDAVFRIIFNCPENIIHPGGRLVNYYLFTSHKWSCYAGLLEAFAGSFGASSGMKKLLHLPKNILKYLGGDANLFNSRLTKGTTCLGGVSLKTILFSPSSAGDDRKDEWGAAYVMTTPPVIEGHTTEEIDYLTENKLLSEEISAFMVIEAPSTEYLDSLLNEKDFEEHYSDSSAPNLQPQLIIHLTPSDIVSHPKYQQFLTRFSSTTKHVLVNNKNTAYGNEEFLNGHRMMRIFCPLVQKLYLEDLVHENCNSSRGAQENSRYIDQFKTVETNFLLRVYRYGLEYIEEKVDLTPEDVMKNDLSADKVSLETLSRLKSDHEKIAELRAAQNRPYPNITFLGTGATSATKNRRQSAILIELSDNYIALLDCGSGTWDQIVRLHGLEKAHQVVKKIRYIFISHAHTDHLNGIYTLLTERRQAFQRSSEEVPNLVIMSTPVVKSAIMRFHTTVDDILNQNSQLISLPLATKFYSHFGLTVAAERTDHKCASFGILLNYDNVKICYSGDTRPCARLIKLGRNCDILIHEATHSDGQEHRSIATSHSTVGEAINVGRAMNAKEVYLTHFGVRFKLFPVTNEPIPANMAHAFDFMKVHLGDTHYLKNVADAIETIFYADFNKIRGNLKKSAPHPSR